MPRMSTLPRRTPPRTPGTPSAGLRPCCQPLTRQRRVSPSLSLGPRSLVKRKERKRRRRRSIAVASWDSTEIEMLSTGLMEVCVERLFERLREGKEGDDEEGPTVNVFQLQTAATPNAVKPCLLSICLLDISRTSTNVSAIVFFSLLIQQTFFIKNPMSITKRYGRQILIPIFNR